MAERVDISEDDITCPICVEVFTEPVLLSCQHSFCRECLRQYTLRPDKQSKCGHDETSYRPDHVITCPLCRSNVDLGAKGVAGLPTQLTLANIVEKHRCQRSVEDQLPKCSVCVDEDSNPAVSFCLTYSIFYCQDCVNVVQQLGTHNLITVEEYLRQYKPTGTPRTTADVMVSSEQCDDHGLQILAFCETCQRPLCKDCPDDHYSHLTHSIEATYRKTTKILQAKTTALTQLKTEVEKILAELDKFHADLEEKKSLHIAEIEKAYNKAIETVKKWRRDRLDATKKRHEGWLLVCTRTTTCLKLQTEEIERLIRLSKEEPSRSRVSAVTCHFKLTSRIDDLTASVQGDLQRNRDVKIKLQDEVDLDVPIPRKLFIRESTVSTPELMFIKSLSDSVAIRESGKVLFTVKDNPSFKFSGALADGRLQSGRHYWELDLTITTKVTPRNDIRVYSAGVVKNVPGRWYVGGCNHSWGVIVKHRSNRYITVCRHGDKDQTNPLPVYPENVSTRSHVRQGFYLNCDQRTLTVLDCIYNHVLHTFTNLDMSEPLIPAVTVHDYHELNVTVRLRQGNLSTLFKLLPRPLWY